MGATLKRRGASFRWKRDSWPEVLSLAEESGWRPAGTLPPRGTRRAEWDGMDYANCHRQLVTAPDAAALADALTRALASHPATRRGQFRMIGGLSADGLEDFTAFCRAGAFRVTDDVCWDD